MGRDDLSDDLLDRPLTARSVIASLLLGRHPPRAPVALLVRWCALFGISETAARVALSRMVERGELAAADATYELAGRILGRQVDQDFAFTPALDAWDGRWSMAIVSDGRRGAADRVALREALRRSRMVPWRDGVWMRPDNLGDHAATASDRTIIDAQCTWWRGRPAGDDTGVEVTAAFDLAALQARGSLLAGRLAAATARLPDPVALAGAFVTGAAAAQHLRRDPLLPAELLPPGWHGDALRDGYRTYVDAMGRAVTGWSRSG